MIPLLIMPTGPERMIAVAIIGIGIYVALVGLVAWWNAR